MRYYEDLVVGAVAGFGDYAVAQMGRTAEASLGSPGLDELKWLRPVHPGDRLRVETELLEKRLSASRPGLGLTKSRTTTFNQDGVAVMTFVANGMIRTRPVGG